MCIHSFNNSMLDEIHIEFSAIYGYNNITEIQITFHLANGTEIKSALEW